MNVFYMIKCVAKFFVQTAKNIYYAIGMDGFAHLFLSALIVLFSCVAGLPMVWSALLTLAIGIGKEGLDKVVGGHPSWHDIICDCLGIMVGLLLFAIGAII